MTSGYRPVMLRCLGYRPVMLCYVVWANCDKESVYRVLRLQKRAARVISYADRMTPSVALFNKLGDSVL